MKKPRIKTLLIFICMLAAGICYSCDRHGLRTSDYQQEIVLTSVTAEEITVEETEQEMFCYVHICGEVNAPGVYEMKEGSRIFQAVDQAGGFTSAAAPEYLNMAEEIRDGMKIQVPSLEEVEAGMTGNPAAEMSEQKININSASKEQLMTLTGIGEARAGDIIRYREEHGPFQTIEDIMEVSGIKDAAFRKIKDDITV